jgi:hypothetical protein
MKTQQVNVYVYTTRQLAVRDKLGQHQAHQQAKKRWHNKLVVLTIQRLRAIFALTCMQTLRIEGKHLLSGTAYLVQCTCGI